jgi:hypothetical protein
MRLLSVILTLGVLLSGCAYPRRGTLVHAAPPSAEPADTPSHLWSIRLVGGLLPETKGGGLAWDSDGTGPDPYLRLFIDGRMIWESPVQENTRKPQWNVTLPRNINVPSRARFRIELWDDDTASSDPAGAYTRMGLPENALPDASARLTLDNLGSVTIVISKPQPSKGLGVEYEQRSDALVLLRVDEFSPAARAGIKVGESVVSIAGARVSSLTGAKAASELSLSADRGSTLIIADAKGKEREVTLDRDFLWLTM